MRALKYFYPGDRASPGTFNVIQAHVQSWVDHTNFHFVVSAL